MAANCLTQFKKSSHSTREVSQGLLYRWTEHSAMFLETRLKRIESKMAREAASTTQNTFKTQNTSYTRNISMPLSHLVQCDEIL